MHISFEDIRRIVNKHDPEGLFRLGAPEDEYDHEVGRIHRSLAGLEKNPDYRYILELVEYVFYVSFDISTKADGTTINLRKPQYSWFHDPELKASFIAFEIASLLENK